MQLTASATMLQRPMARISCGCSSRGDSCVIVLLYHKARGRWLPVPTGSAFPKFEVEEPAVRYTYATHLECSATGERHDIARLQGLSAAGKPLLARYDLAALRRDLQRTDIEARPPSLWRWRE